MTKLLLSILFFIFNFSANATEIDLPNNLGKINILNNVVIVSNGTNIPNGDYEVIVDGNRVVIHFENNNGVIK